LDFESPDFYRFPCLRLALAALAKGGTAPAILNAANEVAVQSFLDGGIRFNRDCPYHRKYAGADGCSRGFIAAGHFGG
jgi:1-deoxy-D-xylulose 5-phosphate reductoisomerase